MDNDGLKNLGHSLSRVVSGIGPSSAIMEIHVVWNEVVGDHVAAHSKPRRVADGVLVVQVDHPGWATELRFLEAMIVEGLTERGLKGVVNSVQVTVGNSDH